MKKPSGSPEVSVWYLQCTVAFIGRKSAVPLMSPLCGKLSMINAINTNFAIRSNLKRLEKEATCTLLLWTNVPLESEFDALP